MQDRRRWFPQMRLQAIRACPHGPTMLNKQQTNKHKSVALTVKSIQIRILCLLLSAVGEYAQNLEKGTWQP